MPTVAQPDSLDCPMRIDYLEARALLRARLGVRVLASESIALAAAAGRVLAAPLHARGDVPGFVHSAMDGYAVRAADLAPDRSTRLHLAGGCTWRVSRWLAPRAWRRLGPATACGSRPAPCCRRGPTRS